jgi:hypothetical protein
MQFVSHCNFFLIHFSCNKEIIVYSINTTLINNTREWHRKQSRMNAIPLQPKQNKSHPMLDSVSIFQVIDVNLITLILQLYTNQLISLFAFATYTTIPLWCLPYTCLPILFGGSQTIPSRSATQRLWNTKSDYHHNRSPSRSTPRPRRVRQSFTTPIVQNIPNYTYYLISL